MLGRMKREHRRFSLDKKKYRRAGSTWKGGEDSYLDFPCVKMKISECKFWERPNWPQYRDLFPNSAQQLGARSPSRRPLIRASVGRRGSGIISEITVV